MHTAHRHSKTPLLEQLFGLFLAAGLFVAAGLFLAAGLSSAAHSATEMLDQVVAVVDDDIVMASELRERLATVSENIKLQGGEAPPEDVLIRETLDRLILENIQIQMGDRFGVRISDAQLDQAMGRIAAQNRLTPEQFAILLEQEGRSYTEIRENIEREMVIQRVQQGNVNQLIQISEQEIANYLSTEEGQKLVQPEYRIVHALLPLSSDASEAEIERSRRYCETLIERIRSGESFEVVMSSAPEQYAFTGGDLGWRKLADLPSLFQEVAPTISRGETADLFESPSGLHIVTMADQRGGGEMTISQTKVRHILLKPSEILSDEQARELAEKLKARAEGGEDFGDLAREYSEDIGSAAEGGALGWTSPGQMVPEFENTMASTEINAISAPVRSQFGWHILEVLDRREKDVTEDMRKAQVQEFLHGRKYQEELDAWLRKIRDEAFVDIK
ncbi:MAG: peptidylprolyl isomerase [Congregibacter sp.]|nr:peptidylprolyl isomerase [Congregibacter sp.]